MSTNVNLLGKGLKNLAILVFLFIASPITLTIGFKAIDKFENIWSYLIIVFAGVLIIFTIFFAFKTFKTLLKAFFND